MQQLSFDIRGLFIMTHVAASQMHTLLVKLLLVIFAAAPSCVVLKSVLHQFDSLRTGDNLPAPIWIMHWHAEKSIESLDLTSENEWRGLMNAILSISVLIFAIWWHC